MTQLHRLTAFLLITSACGGEATPSAPPATAASASPAFDNTRPNVIHGIQGTVDGTPGIVVTPAGLTVDGAKVADNDAASMKKAKRIDGILHALSDWKKAHGEVASGRVAVGFDRDTPWVMVESVLGTAAHGGFPHVALLTRLPEEGGVSPSHLDLVVDKDKKLADRALHVTLSSRGAVMLKWMEGSKQIGDVASADAVVTTLPPIIERGWNERGLHRDPNDKQLDQALLHIEGDTPYALLAVVVDALHAPKRMVASNTVPAFAVNVVAE